MAGEQEVTCRRILEQAAVGMEELKPEVSDAGLTVYGSTGRLEFMLHAECLQGGLLLALAVPGFFEQARKLASNGRVALLYEKLFELAGQEALVVAKLEDTLMISRPAPEGGYTSDDVVGFFSYSVLLVLWLTAQLETVAAGGEPKPFSLEEAARIIQGRGAAG